MNLTIIGVEEATFYGFDLDSPARCVCLYYQSGDSCCGELSLNDKDIRDFSPVIAFCGWDGAVGKSLGFRFDELGVLQDLTIL